MVFTQEDTSDFSFNIQETSFSLDSERSEPSGFKEKPEFHDFQPSPSPRFVYLPTFSLQKKLCLLFQLLALDGTFSIAFTMQT